MDIVGVEPNTGENLGSPNEEPNPSFKNLIDDNKKREQDLDEEMAREDEDDRFIYRVPQESLSERDCKLLFPH